MTVRSTILQQIEVDLLRRSILMLEAKRDLADVVGTYGATPGVPYEVRLQQLRRDLAREQAELDKLNLAGTDTIQLPSLQPAQKTGDAGLI